MDSVCLLEFEHISEYVNGNEEENLNFFSSSFSNYLAIEAERFV